MNRLAAGFAHGGGVATVAATLMLASLARAAPPAADATGKARAFLVGLVDAELGLVPEYHGASVYWLFHDNYLAAKVLEASHPDVAQTIRRAIEREGVHRSGKIELLFGEAERPLPFRQYELLEVRRAGGKLIRTEVATDRVLDGWTEYADLLLLAAVAEPDRAAARQHWDAAIKLWDGHGFLDAAARHERQYATYKLGLALVAASRLSPRGAPPEGLLEALLALQHDSGGWVTDYDSAGRALGQANVETTCLAILGIEAYAERKPEPVP